MPTTHLCADRPSPYNDRLLTGRDGFTLLEVMVAVAILAITLVTLLGMQSRSLSLATEAKFNSVASMLALAKLAEIESGLTALESDSGTFGDDFPGFAWKIESTDASSDVPEALAQLEQPFSKIELSVTWEGTPMTYQLVYYDRQHGP